MGMVGCFAAVDPVVLDRLKADPGLIEEYLYPDDGDEPPNAMDVDKAWHGIHFLLTGDPDGGEAPLAWAVLGGEEIGEEIGYGPARFLTPQQVKQVSEALAALGESALRERFDAEAMAKAEIYPDGIWVREGEEALEYLVENYRELVVFYAGAAARGDGALIWLS